MHTWLVLISVLCLCYVTYAQECVDPCSLPMQYCTYVNYPISPYNLNVTKNEEEAGEIVGNPLFNSNPFPDCKLALEQLACGRVYPSCNNDTSPVTEIKPCWSMCEQVHVACAFILTNFPQEFTPDQMQLINCSAVRDDGTPIYETDETKCVNLTNVTPLPCFNSSNNNPGGGNSNNTNPAGGCQIYNTSLTPNTASMCAAFVSAEVFTPSTDPSYLTTVDSQLASELQLFQEAYSLIPQNCFKMLASLLCQAAFPSCVHVNDTFEAANPHCFSYCEDTFAVCGDLLSLIGSSVTSLLNCSMESPLAPGTPQWPTTNCNTQTIPSDALVPLSLPVVTSCPSVMGLKKHPKEDEAWCSYPCPDRTYTSKQIDALIAVLLTFGSISFVLLVVMGVSQALVWEKRRFPINIQICLCICLSFMMASYFFGGHHPQTTVWCEDPGTYNTQHTNHYCATQAFFFSYFGLVAIILCTFLAMTLFLVVVAGVKLPALASLQIYLQIFCWGLPLPFALTAVGMGKYGYMPMLPFCFIVFEDITHLSVPKSGGLTLDWSLFFIPMGFFAVVSFVTFSATVLRIVYVRWSVRDTVASDTGVTQHAQRRVGLFVLVLSVIIIIILEWRIEIEADGLTKLENKVEAWFTCKIKTELGIPDPGYCPEETTPSGVSYGHLMVICILASSLGIIVFGFFGFDPNNYKVWPLVYQTIFVTHDYEELWRVVAYGRYSQSSANLTNRTQSKNSKTTAGHNGTSPSQSQSSLSKSLQEEREESISIELDSQSGREQYT